MFKRLDLNQDGVVTPNEIPPGMPERLKQLVLSADKTGDKRITLRELKATINARRPAGQPAPVRKGRRIAAAKAAPLRKPRAGPVRRPSRWPICPA